MQHTAAVMIDAAVMAHAAHCSSAVMIDAAVMAHAAHCSSEDRCSLMTTDAVGCVLFV